MMNVFPTNTPHRGTPPPDFAALMGKSATLSRGPPNPYDLSNLLIMGRARGATPAGVPPLKLPETLKSDVEEKPPNQFLYDINKNFADHNSKAASAGGVVVPIILMIGALLYIKYGR